MSVINMSNYLFLTLFTCRKDDAEFFAGDIVSKIIVPHPALGFPTTLSLHYKSYSGWLSKGLPHWDIDKVVLTDSFGRSHSLCRPSTKLSSGSPVRLRLQAGNCELDNQEDYGAYTTQPPAAPPAQHAGNPTVAVPTDVPDSSVQESGLAASVDGVESAKQRKDIFNLGTSFKLARNQTYPLDQGDELPWQPILVGNSLDNETAEAAESSRSLSDSIAGEIFEPVLKDRRLAVNRGRNLQDYATTDSPEIMEPVLKATTPRVKQGKDLDLSESELAAGMVTTLGAITSAVAGSSRLPAKTMAQVGTGRSPDPDEPQTVQLLPFRLGELLQRAERYARETLLPLISVQAPRFFGFNVTPHDREPVRPGESRKPRYIPRYEESAFLNTSSNARRRSQKASRRSSAQQRNLLRLVRARSHGLDDGEDGSDEQREGEREQRNEVNYYTNVLQSESRSMRPEAPEYRPVFIDLPTYKPKTAAAFSTSAAVSAPLASAAVSGSVSLSRARRRGRSPKLIPWYSDMQLAKLSRHRGWTLCDMHTRSWLWHGSRTPIPFRS